MMSHDQWLITNKLPFEIAHDTINEKLEKIRIV